MLWVWYLPKVAQGRINVELVTGLWVPKSMHVESESPLMESHRKATVAVGCTFCLDEVAHVVSV